VTRLIGLFGGTFDPVHRGHLSTIDALAAEIPFSQVRFIVSARPPLRNTPDAEPTHRAAMVELAIGGHAGWIVDTRELARPGPSYTLWTLRSLRTEFPREPLCWIIGADAFERLHSWYQWFALPALAHFIVLPRPGAGAVRHVQLAGTIVDTPVAMNDAVAGCVYFARTPEIPVSASDIRRRIREGKPLNQDLLPDVWRYVQTHGLYQCSEPERGVYAV